MDNFNFRVANAAPRASGFEIGQNVRDTKTTYIYSYKTKYINGKSTGQKTNVDWDMESSIPPWVSVKYVFEGNDCKVTFTTLQENTGSSARTHTLEFKQRESGQTIVFPITQKALDPIIKLELSFADQSSALVNQGPVHYTLNYNDQFLETGTIPAGGVIQVPQNTWADNGGDTAVYTLYMKGSEIKSGSTFYFQCKFYAINGWEGLLVDSKYNKALNYKIDTVQPNWNPSGTIQSGTIYLYKGNLSPSDFSGGILIELTLGTKINGYVKKAMIRVKVN